MAFSTQDTNDAILNPRVGDHWYHDSTHVIVVKTAARLIWTLEGSASSKSFIDSSEVHQWLREQYNARMRKGGKTDFHFRPIRDKTGAIDLLKAENLAWMALQKRDFDVKEWFEKAAIAGRPWHEHGKVW